MDQTDFLKRNFASRKPNRHFIVMRVAEIERLAAIAREYLDMRRVNALLGESF